MSISRKYVMSKKWIHISLFSLFLIIVFLSHVTGNPIFTSDSYTYMAMANAMSKGNWYLESWGRGPLGASPFYPLLIEFGKTWLGMENHIGAFLISVFSSASLILLCFLWAVRRFGWGWAWVVALLVAFNKDLIYFANTLLTEPLFTLLFFAASALSWVILCQKRHPLLYLFVGVLMGVAIITKGSALILPVILLGWIILRVLSGFMTVQRGLTVGVIAILGVLVITQPVAWKSHIPGGRVEHTGKKSFAAMWSKPDLREGLDRERYLAELNPAGDEFKVELSQGDASANLMISRWPDILKIIIINYGLAIKSLFIVVPWWLLIWIPAGMLIQWIRGDRGGLIFSVYLLTLNAGLIGLYSLAEAFTSALGPERYAVPLIPILILLVASGLHSTYNEVQRYCNGRKFYFKTAGIGIVSLLIVLVFYSSIGTMWEVLFESTEIRWRKSALQLIGEEIKERFGPGNRIMARTSGIPYYADGLWVLTPFEPLDRVIAFARGRGVHLMIVRLDIAEYRPMLYSLLRKDFIHPDLHRIAFIPSRRDDDLMEVAVYVFTRAKD